MEDENIVSNEDPGDSEDVEFISDATEEMEPAAKCRKVDIIEEEADDCCSICFEAFQQSGEHRIASLKCGHLFGFSCIQRWLKGQSKLCPSCKTKAGCKDIRFIYAKKLVAIDNTELEAVNSKLVDAQARCLKMEMEINKMNFVHTTLNREISDLRTVNALLRNAIGENTTFSRKKVMWRLSLEKTLDVCAQGTCRVITHDAERSVLFVTKHNQNPLFPGFGVSTINYETFATGTCLNLHPKAIRDMSYSGERDCLLTASLDKSAKLVSMGSGRVATSFECDIPLWSCTWDVGNADRLYVGGPGGVVLQYDVRQPRTCLARLQQSDVSPVVSLASTPHGILSCHLNSCWLHEPNGQTFDSQNIPIEGPFISLTYDSKSEKFLISSRPSKLCPHSRHNVCQYNANQTTVEQTFSGSTLQTLMSRSCLLNLSEDTLVAAHSEADSALALYSLLSSSKVQSLPSQDHIIDTSSIASEKDSFLATLSGNKVRLYKAVSCS